MRSDALTTTRPAIPFGKPVLSKDERDLILQVLNGVQLTQGPLVRQFEAAFAEFTSGPRAVAVSSCMGALHLGYLFLGLEPGDEVIVPAQTHVATAMAVELCGGRCVFVDSEPATGNIDLEQLEACITPKTRAISLVHFLGMPVDMERVVAIARPRGLSIVEDCALALGARCRGRHVGLHGDFGAFSFYPVKHIATGEGGMLLTSRQDLADASSRQRAFSVEKVVTDGVAADDYDVRAVGLNYRMSELAAALGVGQMRHLPDFLAARRDNYRGLSDRLREIDGISLLLSSHDHLESAYYCHCVVLDDRLVRFRADIMKSIRARGIGVSVYYPRPVPAMAYFRTKYDHPDGAFPVARRISNATFALPVGPHVKQEDVEYIADAVQDAIVAATRA